VALAVLQAPAAAAVVVVVAVAAADVELRNAKLEEGCVL
jgi:hypothetical protein